MCVNASECGGKCRDTRRVREKRRKQIETSKMIDEISLSTS